MLTLLKRKSWPPKGVGNGFPLVLGPYQKKKKALGIRWSERMGHKITTRREQSSGRHQQQQQGSKSAAGDTFHRAVAPSMSDTLWRTPLISTPFKGSHASVLVLAQFFGLMPVNGILNRDISQQEFRWMSLRTIYAVFCCGSLAVYAVLTLSYNFIKRMTIESFVSCVFYGSNTTVIVSFLFLARKWPKLIAKWSEIERELLPKTQIKQGKRRMWHDWQLSTKIRLITGAILCLCAIEHSLSIKRYFFYAENCPKVRDRTKAIFVQHFTELFYFTPYNLPKAIWARFMITICVFTWSYMDCFVSIVSVGISSGFYKINSQMRVVKGMNVPEEFWKRQRRNYRNLCELCELVDNHISHLTMTSFTNNLFFICVQLLNSMQIRPSVFHSFYFWFSLILLIGRTLAVILFSSQINDQSRGPMEYIRVVPGQTWCLELKRFYEEVATDTIALTGMKFFNLTRGVILSVAGTIITYELVLIQLRSKHPTESDLCEEIYY